MTGETLQIALCRAIVLRELGSLVEVPEEYQRVGIENHETETLYSKKGRRYIETAASSTYGTSTAHPADQRHQVLHGPDDVITACCFAEYELAKAWPAHSSQHAA